MRLSELELGQEFTVRAVRIPREIGKRLADMGFTEGAPGRIVRRGAFRGPLQVQIRGYDVLIRSSEAASIEVETTNGRVGDSSPAPRRFHGRHGGRGRHGTPWRVGNWEGDPSTQGDAL